MRESQHLGLEASSRAQPNAHTIKHERDSHYCQSVWNDTSIFKISSNEVNH